MIKAIIFDVDGVIFDTEWLHIIAWEIVFKNKNIIIPPEKYRGGTGVADQDFLQDLRKCGILPVQMPLAAVEEEKISVLTGLIEKSTEIFPGAIETLEMLYGKYPMCAASNSDRRFIEKLVGNSKVGRFFSFILTRNDVKNPKPSPDIYLLAAKKLGYKPHECVVIEDTSTGVDAARSAGTICIAVCHTQPAEKLAVADIVLPRISPKDIESFLLNKNS